MGRKSRQASATGLYHVIIRGNNKHRLFHGQKDFTHFKSLLKANLKKQPVKIYHYCLMTNHVHLLMGSETVETISRFMHSVQRSYHHYYRKTHTWFGHLFQGRYRSLPIDDEVYLLECGRYIERNPVRAKMVEDPKDWDHSSYRVYGYGEQDDVVESFSAAYKALASNEADRQHLYRKHVEGARPYEEMLDKKLMEMK